MEWTTPTFDEVCLNCEINLNYEPRPGSSSFLEQL